MAKAMTNWFCYELDFALRPTPVVYYGELPTTRGGGKETIPTRRQLVTLTEPPTGADGEYSIAALVKQYPYIPQKEKIDNSTEAVVKEKVEMVRPVEGFMTAQGKFYDHEDEAELYEASYNLHGAARKAVLDLGVSGDANVEAAVEAMVVFINKNPETISEYLRAKRAIEHNAVDGPSTPSTKKDDTQIRDDAGVPVDGSTTPEAEPKSTRKVAK